MRYVLVALLVLYRRYLSPYLGGGCRFQPSCSEYALEAVRRFGAIVGIRLTAARLRRCRPPHPCGLDPVPTPGSVQAALRGELVVHGTPDP